MSAQDVVRHVAPSADEPSVRRLRFHCPGCRYGHMIRVDASASPSWSWNGDMVKPTFSPSLNVMPNGGLRPRGPGVSSGQCHSFVENGMIRFLSDCWHELAGQTVPLPAIGYTEDD